MKFSPPLSRLLQCAIYSALWSFALASLQAEVSDPSGVFSEANRYYEDAAYAKAIATYKQLLPHHQSAAIHYNLGNAYYKNGHYPEAILQYEKAMLLNPRNPDIRANLKLAQSSLQLPTTDYNWLQFIALYLSINQWAWLFAFTFWAAVGLIVLPRLWAWRGPLRGGLLAISLTLCLVALAALAGYHQLSKTGIAIAEETALKLSPTRASVPDAYLKPGQRARIERRHGDFFYVNSDDGKSGWAHKEAFRPIWE